MTSSITVLHVDDDPEFADLAATFLKRADGRFEVITRTSASEGFDRLADDIDCVVSDYDMPGENGIDFLDTVRNEFDELPFVLFTGKGSEEIASEAISAGVTDYLQKGNGTHQFTVLANRIENAVDRYRARTALEESQRRLSMFIDQSPLGVIEWDEDFSIARVNRAAKAILGYDETALVGRSWETIVPGEERSTVADNLDALREGAGGYHSINRNVTSTGGTIVCEWHNRVVTDDHGELVSIFSLFQDITDREERKAELEWKTRAMDEAPVGILITDPTRPDNPIIYANDRFESLTGYSKTEAIGRNCRFLQGPDTDAETVATIRRAIDDREPTSAELVNYRKDGTEFWNRVTIAPVGGADDAPRNFVGFQEDITDRKEREHELQRYETILEAVGDPVYEVDADGRYVFVNDAFIEETGYPRLEIIGAHVSKVLSVEAVERGTRVIRDLLRDPDRRTVTWEMVRTTADGDRIPSENHVALLPFDDGNFTGTAGVVRNISERKEREGRLKALHSATRKLMAADTEEEIAEITVDAAFETLGFPNTVVRLMSEDSMSLRVVSQSERAKKLMGRRPDYAVGEGPAGRAFEEQRPLLFENIADIDDGYDRGEARAGMYIPIGNTERSAFRPLKPASSIRPTSNSHRCSGPTSPAPSNGSHTDSKSNGRSIDSRTW